MRGRLPRLAKGVGVLYSLKPLGDEGAKCQRPSPSSGVGHKESRLFLVILKKDITGKVTAILVDIRSLFDPRQVLRLPSIFFIPEGIDHLIPDKVNERHPVRGKGFKTLATAAPDAVTRRINGVFRGRSGIQDVGFRKGIVSPSAVALFKGAVGHGIGAPDEKVFILPRGAMGRFRPGLKKGVVKDCSMIKIAGDLIGLI